MNGLLASAGQSEEPCEKPDKSWIICSPSLQIPPPVVIPLIICLQDSPSSLKSHHPFEGCIFISDVIPQSARRYALNSPSRIIFDPKLASMIAEVPKSSKNWSKKASVFPPSLLIYSRDSRTFKSRHGNFSGMRDNLYE